MPGGAGGGGMPGGGAGGGMPDLSALFSDPELMAAMQVSAAFIICRLRVVGLSQLSSKTYSYKTGSIFRTLSNMFPGIVFAKIVNSLKSLIIYVWQGLHKKSVSSFKIKYSHGRWYFDAKINQETIMICCLI